MVLKPLSNQTQLQSALKLIFGWAVSNASKCHCSTSIQVKKCFIIWWLDFEIAYRPNGSHHPSIRPLDTKMHVKTCAMDKCLYWLGSLNSMCVVKMSDDDKRKQNVERKRWSTTKKKTRQNKLYIKKKVHKRLWGCVYDEMRWKQNRKANKACETSYNYKYNYNLTNCLRLWHKAVRLQDTGHSTQHFAAFHFCMFSNHLKMNLMIVVFRFWPLKKLQ